MLKAGPKAHPKQALPDIEDDVEWFEFVTGEPLYSWQREELRTLTQPDRPRVAYVQVARKNGKSRLGAAVAICEARRPQRHIYTIADTERNLNSALMREIRDICYASDYLRDNYVQFKNHIEVPETGSFIETRPNKFASSQSINPHLVVFDEVHLQKNADTWHGMRMAGAAHTDALLLGITSPGYDLNSPAHAFYQAARAGDQTLYSRIFEPDNPETAYEDREQWKLGNPRLADDPGFMAALEEDRAGLPEHEFLRYRLGMWTATNTAWLPYGAWDALASPTRKAPVDGTRIVLGFDGSFSGDSTALVGATLGEEYPHLWVAGCWEKPGAEGWRVPRHEVEATIADCFQRYDVQAMYCDPPYWQREIAEWIARYGDNRIVEFPTGSQQRIAPLCTTFFSGVVERQLSHDGDKRLARHINNCVIKPTMHGDVITKPDKMSPAKIDLAVAAVLAYGHGATNVYKKRSPLFIG